jgi:hypothetical protein
MKARSNSEKGMALIITLMMLAIVTFMAVIFLSISRRERTSVKISEEQNTARQMADAGTARAAAVLIAGMEGEAKREFFKETNAGFIKMANGTIQRAKFHYELNASRTYVNASGFDTSVNGYDPANVSYTNKSGAALVYGSADYNQNVANLQYDPRAPVFAIDPITGNVDTKDFRYYLDLNRNGTNDPTGRFDPMTPENKKIGQEVMMVGDPEWIGVLERPDFPHSESNRFIGRYAFLTLPEGKSLDANFIHNQAVSPQDPLRSGAGRYARDWGAGSYELNLAAFLVDFHKGIWWTNRPAAPYGRPTDYYNYAIFTDPPGGFGVAFSDASGILGYRLARSPQNLETAENYFRDASQPGFPKFNLASGFWSRDFADLHGAGGYVRYNDWYTNNAPIRTGLLRDLDNPTRPWFGMDKPAITAEYADVQKYFSLPGTITPAEFKGFTNRFLAAVSTNSANNYDKYAYYRFVGQMGVDSVPALAGKIHLNYANEPGTLTTNLIPWVSGTNGPIFAYPTAISRPRYLVTNIVNGSTNITAWPNHITNFFLLTADAMLRQSLVTNVFQVQDGPRIVWVTNYTVGGTYFTNEALNLKPLQYRQVANPPVQHDISITNIQIYHVPYTNDAFLAYRISTNEYLPAVHRILQLAANIFDNMTNAGPNEPYYPSVFRPIFVKTSTNVYISAFVSDPVANTFPVDWVTAEDFFFNRPRVLQGDRINIFGQPVIIGAKKGWPTFNEMSLETYVNVGRKLEVVKNPAQNSNVLIETNQLYTVGISNVFALEAWNSFAKAMNRRIEVRAMIRTGVALESPPNAAGVVTQYFGPKTITSTPTNLPYIVNNWPGSGKPWQQREASIPPNPDLNLYQPSDFRLPIHHQFTLFTNMDFTGIPPFYFNSPDVVLPTFVKGFAIPQFRLNMTNDMFYYAVALNVDGSGNGRIIDLVSLEKVVSHIDITDAMGKKAGLTNNAGNAAFGNGNIPGVGPGTRNTNPDDFWEMALVDKNGNTNTTPTVGLTNQIAVSMGTLNVDNDQWTAWSPYVGDKEKSILDFQEWLKPVAKDQRDQRVKRKQVPFSPVRLIYIKRSFQVNDPFVRFMAADLRNPYEGPNGVEILKPGSHPRNTDIGGINAKVYRPWGTPEVAPNNYALQDPRVFNSDAWQFPITKLDNTNSTANATNFVYGVANFNYVFPSIGQLGRVHRGTPWQTVYLKSAVAPMLDAPNGEVGWVRWAGSWGTHPTNDWILMDLFTTALSENSARGLLSVNQTNIAAWSAVLSGVQVITNSVTDKEYNLAPALTPPRFGLPDTGDDLLIEPASTQLSNIVAGINNYRSKMPLGVFGHMGEILGTPELSDVSPFLHRSGPQFAGNAFTDEAFEAIPQRVLSLLKADEPRIVIYAFGQTLKPAPRSLSKQDKFYGLSLNYQVTGEYATKTIMRVEGDVRSTNAPLRTVVESFEQLAPFDQ